ncbi:hypothetical protein JCM5353_006641 [Sporobolomyces roseus]
MSPPSPSTPVYRDPLPPTFPLSSLPSLTEEKNPIDNKSLLNPPRSALLPHSEFKPTRNDEANLSAWYTSYPEEFVPEKNAFDFHIYYSNPSQTLHASKLHRRIRYEFPELRIYKFWDKPVGPHPFPMFEVNTFTPDQFGALFGFLVAHRGGLSVLIHPNTDDELADHTEKAVWMGEKLELDTSFLQPQSRAEAMANDVEGTTSSTETK